jgi:PGF-CTERM protein
VDDTTANMKLTRTSAVLVTALVVALAAVALPAAGSLATPGNPPEPDTTNREPTDGADFQVRPDDPTPDTGTAYTMLSRGKGPWDGSDGLERISYYKITTQDTRFKGCSPSDAQAFGIDRDNDAEGTKTDTGLLRHMEQYSVSGRIIAVDIYDPGALGGEPTYLNDTDETVAKLANCVVTPSEPGWYQFKGYVNGTNYQGNFQEVLLYSKYFYICECSSEAEAEEQLGPKPYSEDDSTDGGSSGGSSEQTATATATATPEQSGGSSGGSSETTATATATPTATATATPTATATATATPGQSGGGSSGGSSEQTATATAASGGANTATATAAQGGGGGGASGQQAGGGARSGSQERVTPTAGSGPGFGVVAALGGLLALGLFARRRN